MRFTASLRIEAAANTTTPTVDVAHFRHLTGEWQISGIGAQLQELYRQPFGVAFHGSANALVHSKRYSLEPLRDGPSCLKCDINSRIQVAELVSLKIALYALLRFHILTAACLGPAFSCHLLLGFGLLSMFLAAPFILVQENLKR